MGESRAGSIRFIANDGTVVPAVSAEQMREVDRIAVEEFGLGILQMMENAGRSLAENAMALLPRDHARIVILAGTGGNGGGGLCCARHLRNRGWAVDVAVTRPPDPAGAAGRQLQVLEAAGLSPLGPEEVPLAIQGAELVVDALIGYGLTGSARGIAARWIELTHEHEKRVLSLDVPSGLDATTGRHLGPMMRPERTLTLALPKTGLMGVGGALFLADIGITPEVYARLGIAYRSPFAERYWLPITAEKDE